MKHLSILLALLLFHSGLRAQQYKKELDDLISRGNMAYEYSQQSKIKECADSIAAILSEAQLNDDSRKDYTVSLLKLYGNYHYESANLDSAEYYYQQAKSIIDSNKTTDFHGSELIMLRELAQLYYRRLEYDKALNVMSEVDDRLEYMYQNVGDNLWLISKLTYAMCLARTGETEDALKIAEDELEKALDRTGLEYRKAQRMHGKIKLLADADKIGALNSYKEYFNSQKGFALANFAEMNAREREEYWQTLRPFIADCYLLEEADPGFLYDVALFSKGLLLQLTRVSGDGKASGTALKTLDYKWQDIQKRLKKGDTAIEFIQYGEGDDQKMGALLLKHIGKPVFVPLTSPDRILTVAGKALGSTSRLDKDRLYGDTTLQNMVWTPELLAAIDGVSRLYFAPDGYLHRLAIEYMPQVRDIDTYRVSSTRRLMEPSSPKQAINSALAFGAINYDLDRNPGKVESNDSKAFSNYIGKSFPKLSDATDETKEIIAERNNQADSIVSGAKASESAFRQLAPRYSSILLSTHGDFCASTPIETDLKPAVSDDTMSKSILAFSGINSHLRDPGFDATTQSDGIISAKELSALDLRNCRLFTASACQTALGEITSDGVFGLQRGLKNAGVDVMLLSLWSVSSEATSLLMKRFYHNLNSGMSLKKSFEEARKALLSGNPMETTEYVFDPSTMAYKSEPCYSRPFNAPQYTNAFILIDAID
ncbi:MAG: CHAT domain-containing protein [Muribaculaceae bacterium]|nr:CHAT domain-containing protein [Muribaculaceae bacterium]